MARFHGCRSFTSSSSRPRLRCRGGFNAGFSVLSYAIGFGRQYGAVGASYLTVNWPVPANLFPGGRTQPVTVNLIPFGTKHLERWNQVDVNLKRIVRLGRLEAQPTMEVFNLNSGVALSTVETFGASLDLSTRMLQGRMLKLSMLFKF